MATPSVTDTRRDEALYEQLAAISNELAGVELRRDELLDQRRAFWTRAVECGWTYARIAAASRTTEGAVTAVFRRARKANR